MPTSQIKANATTDTDQHPQNTAISKEMSDDEKIDIVAQQILQKYKPAFLALAK